MGIEVEIQLFYSTFSQCMPDRSKASVRRYSHSTVSFYNAVCEQAFAGLTL